MFQTARAFIRRDFLIAASYRTAFVTQIAGILLTIPMAYFVSRIFEGFQAPSLTEFGGQYFPFLLLGFAFQDYIGFSQSAFNASIREHQLMGTLEIVMLSPTPVPVILVCSSLWGYIFTSLRFGLFLVAGIALGLDLSRANFSSFIVLMLVSVLSFTALGILLAAVTVTIKRSDGVIALFTLTSVVLGGVFYPVSILPNTLQWVAWALPFTHSLTGMRKALLQGAGFSGLSQELLVLTLFSLVVFPLSLLAFRWAINRARVTGTMSQY